MWNVSNNLGGALAPLMVGLGAAAGWRGSLLLAGFFWNAYRLFGRGKRTPLDVELNLEAFPQFWNIPVLLGFLSLLFNPFQSSQAMLYFWYFCPQCNGFSGIPVLGTFQGDDNAAEPSFTSKSQKNKSRDLISDVSPIA